MDVEATASAHAPPKAIEDILRIMRELSERGPGGSVPARCLRP